MDAGDRDGFDGHGPPLDGGRSADDAVVTTAAGAEALLGREPQLPVAELAVEPGGELVLQPHDGVAAVFVLDGEVEVDAEPAGQGSWITVPQGPLRNPGTAAARLLSVRAPAL